MKPPLQPASLSLPTALPDQRSNARMDSRVPHALARASSPRFSPREPSRYFTGNSPQSSLSSQAVHTLGLPRCDATDCG